MKTHKRPRQKYTANTCMGELFADPKAQQILGQMMGNNEQAKEIEKENRREEAVSQEMLAAMMQDMPHSAAHKLRAGHDVGSSGSDT